MRKMREESQQKKIDVCTHIMHTFIYTHGVYLHTYIKATRHVDIWSSILLISILVFRSYKNRGKLLN